MAHVGPGPGASAPPAPPPPPPPPTRLPMLPASPAPSHTHTTHTFVSPRTAKHTSGRSGGGTAAAAMASPSLAAASVTTDARDGAAQSSLSSSGGIMYLGSSVAATLAQAAGGATVPSSPSAVRVMGSGSKVASSPRHKRMATSPYALTRKPSLQAAANDTTRSMGQLQQPAPPPLIGPAAAVALAHLTANGTAKRNSGPKRDSNSKRNTTPRKAHPANGGVLASLPSGTAATAAAAAAAPGSARRPASGSGSGRRRGGFARQSPRTATGAEGANSYQPPPSSRMPRNNHSYSHPSHNNGQPLARLPARSPANQQHAPAHHHHSHHSHHHQHGGLASTGGGGGQLTAIQTYIQQSKAQLGLQPETDRRSTLRFDPLADDFDDEEDVALVGGGHGEHEGAGSPQGHSPAHGMSMHGAAVPSGHSQIAGLVAAQQASKKLRANAKEAVHIAAGVMLPPLTAAALAPVLARIQPWPSPSPSTSSAGNSPAPPQLPGGSASGSPAKTLNQVGGSASTPASPDTVVGSASTSASAATSPRGAAAAGDLTVAAGDAATAPSPTPSPKHRRGLSTVADVGLSEARRASWEKEHPSKAARRSGRSQKLAQEEAERNNNVAAAASSSSAVPPASAAAATMEDARITQPGGGAISSHLAPAAIHATAANNNTHSPTPGLRQAHTSASTHASGGGGGAGGSSSNSRNRAAHYHRRMYSRDVDSASGSSSPASKLGAVGQTPSPHLRAKRESLAGSTAAAAAAASAAHAASQQGQGGPDSNPVRGRIERKTSQPNSLSASPLVAPSHTNSPVMGPTSALVIPAPMLSAAGVVGGLGGGVTCVTCGTCNSNLIVPSANAADSFQQSNSAQMSPDAVQDRWRRNLIKRMSVNISFAPSPFSGLLGSAGAPPQQQQQQQQQGGAAPAGASAAPASSHRHSMRRGSMRNNVGGGGGGGGGEHSSSGKDLHAAHSHSSHAHPGPGPGGHSRSSSLSRTSRISLRTSQSYNPPPPPLSVQQLNPSVSTEAHGHSGGGGGGGAGGSGGAAGHAQLQPYPHNPQFGYMFPHQELLAQQREYYDACSDMLLEYVQWETDQDWDPVVVPARSYALYQPARASASGSGSGSGLGSGLASPSSSFGATTSLEYPAVYPVPPSLPSSFDRAWWSCYSSIQDWECFDIFNFSELTAGWPLSFMFVIVLKRSGIIRRMGLDVHVLFRCIQEVESHYLPNAYHTSIHAADVLHAVYHFLNDSLLAGRISDLDALLLYFSCAIHDISHPGVTSSFLIASKAPLALRYNDRHVLEAFHVASAFRMMQLTPGCNILESWPGASDQKLYARNRKMVIDLVLATDLAMHFDLMRVMKNKFEALIVPAAPSPPAAAVTATTTAAAAVSGTEQAAPGASASAVTVPASSSSPSPPPETPSASLVSSSPSAATTTTAADSAAPATGGATPSSSFSPALVSAPMSQTQTQPQLVLSSDDDITLVLQMLLKLGDLSHPARPKNLHLRWAELVTEEFFSQGDRERSLGLPTSMFMDRYTTNVATSQLGFLTFLVLPLFQVASKLQHNQSWVGRVESNLQLWVELEKIEQKEKEAAEQAEAEAANMGTTAQSATEATDASTAASTAATAAASGTSSQSTTPENAASAENQSNATGGGGGLGVEASVGADGAGGVGSGVSPVSLQSGGGELLLPPRSSSSSLMRSNQSASPSPPKSSVGTPVPASPRLVASVTETGSSSISGGGGGSNSSGASSAMSSGSGSMVGRFSSYCKDRTVLHMFQKVRELGASGTTPAPASTGTPSSVNGNGGNSLSSMDGDSRPDSAVTAPSIARTASVPDVPETRSPPSGASDGTPALPTGVSSSPGSVILEEPSSPRGYTDGSPFSPAGAGAATASAAGSHLSSARSSQSNVAAWLASGPAILAPPPAVAQH